jgi:hypothetical protein
MVSGVLHENVVTGFIYGPVDGISGTMKDMWSCACEKWYKE